MVRRTGLAALCFAHVVGAFLTPSMTSESHQTSRRHLISTGLTVSSAAAVALTVNFPAPASATSEASKMPGADRLVTGAKQLKFLLTNWERETTKCDANGKCAKNPDAVRKALGLRSTTDPLFQIEKVLDKAQQYVDDADDIDLYIESAETFQSTQSMANSMAYTSSFAEYNPGGGVDSVAKYLEESRKQVVLCEEALGNIVRILKLE